MLLAYGKKQGRWPLALGGLAFMVYPYFTETVTSLLLAGVALGVGVWWLERNTG